jgi:hypothetical protein
MVVANELHSRRYRVYIYHNTNDCITLEKKSDEDRDLEEIIVEFIT